MRRLSLLLAVATVVCTLLVASPADAQLRPIDEGGDNRHCVTENEFLTVHPMTPMGRVQRVFDTNGQRVRTPHELEALAGLIGQTIRRGHIVRVYPACEEYPGFRAVVEFGNHSPRKRATFLYFGG